MSIVMEEKIIEVNMAGLEVAQAPARLITRGLGSCLGITLYDGSKKIGGMAHPMLPDIEAARIKSNLARFVNSGIRKMVEELEKRGCSRNQLVAKMFGGAHMFGFITADSILNVGQKNIETALAVFKELDISWGEKEV
jgi:chemotaxis protein CheD